MRHQKAGLKLNRTSSHRKAMFRNMVTSLFKYEKIKTTDAKAKELRKWADHLVTLAKRGDLHARRQALSIIREKEVVYKLFDMASERFGAVGGGYTRIVKIGRRPGDAAPMSIIELISEEEKPKKAKKKKTKKSPEKKAAPAQPKAKKEEAAAAPAESEAEAEVESEETPDSTETVETAAAASEPETPDAMESEEKEDPEKSE